MLEVRDLPIGDQESEIRGQGSEIGVQGSAVKEEHGKAQAQETMQAMETPLVMSGFRPEAIRMWQEQMAGTGLETVAAGGMGSESKSGAKSGSVLDSGPSATAIAGIVPGSAVSAQLVRGDLEIAATCTVTYIDPRQLLACGHSILQAGPVSLPMTATEVVATLASPLNAFKIVNTGEEIGAFTEDRGRRHPRRAGGQGAHDSRAYHGSLGGGPREDWRCRTKGQYRNTGSSGAYAPGRDGHAIRSAAGDQ